jgi:hypothetical protein
MVDIVQRAHLFHDPKRSRIAGDIDESLDNAVTLCWWPCHTTLPPEYLEYTVKEVIEGQHPSQLDRKVGNSNPKSLHLMLVVRTDLLKPLEQSDEAADSGPNRPQLGKRKERTNESGPGASAGTANKAKYQQANPSTDSGPSARTRIASKANPRQPSVEVEQV